MAITPSFDLMDEKTKAMYNVETFMAQFKRADQEHSPSLPGGDPTTYAYIPKLLMHPVHDGRMRLLWLVIAPYVVTILKQPRDKAEEFCREYIQRCHELTPCTKVLNAISEQVDHSIVNDLKPPRLETLEQSDPDLYEIIRVAIAE